MKIWKRLFQSFYLPCPDAKQCYRGVIFAGFFFNIDFKHQLMYTVHTFIIKNLTFSLNCVSFNNLNYLTDDWFIFNRSQIITLLIWKLVNILDIKYRKYIYKEKKATTIREDPKVVGYMWTVTWGLILLTYHTGVFMMSTIMISKSTEWALRKKSFTPITVDLIHPYLPTSLTEISTGSSFCWSINERFLIFLYVL